MDQLNRWLTLFTNVGIGAGTTPGSDQDDPLVWIWGAVKRIHSLDT
jgi:hypothetical protein